MKSQFAVQGRVSSKSKHITQNPLNMSDADCHGGAVARRAYARVKKRLCNKTLGKIRVKVL